LRLRASRPKTASASSTFLQRPPGGTGLGLFLSLNFVRRWGGDIRVESRLSEGSTFEVCCHARPMP